MKAGSPDQKFVLEAAMGGMEEVQLGQLAVSKAASDDVKQFGQHMVDDHSKANDELKALAASKNITLPTELAGKQKADYDKLSKLSGAAFDREYMKMMVDDHNKDVAEFQKESTSGKDPDVKAWAAKTLPTLQQHQTMAKEVDAKVGGHAAMKHGM
jgi:putative membrane protein